MPFLTEWEQNERVPGLGVTGMVRSTVVIKSED